MVKNNACVRKVVAGRLCIVFVAAGLLVLSASACSGENSPEGSTVPENPADVMTDGETAQEATTGDETLEKQFEDFDASNFGSSTSIDNEWLPLRPGMRYVYNGFTKEDGEKIAARVVTTVTDLTKVIDGVHSVVLLDLDYSAGELVEAELAFFAQDNDGNVWRMGEYPEEYEEGKLVDAPAWIAGIQNARAGIAMKAESRLGESSYSQGWAPAVEFTDRARVYQVARRTCVPVDCYEDVLVMEEFSREEPGAFQLKYYAPHVGNVRVGWRGKDESHETLELVQVGQVSPEALTKIRGEALELEKRAYKISENVYGQTPPAEPLGAE
jgi:hypothetical protein